METNNNHEFNYNNEQDINYSEEKTETTSHFINYDDSKSESASSYASYSEPKVEIPNMLVPKKNRGGLKKTLAYVAFGLTCAIIGGAASGAALLYGLPKTKLFENSALYQSLNKGGSTTPAAALYDGHPTQLASKGEALTVSEVAKKVGPAVVAVTTQVQGNVDLFGKSGVQQGVGTGMIINQEGYILTNYHVVEGAQQVKVILSNDKTVTAKVVNYDANYDVAVIKITEKVDIPAIVELGDSDNLQIGESVVAIGNPLGTDFFGSVTTGVVSALNRKIDGDTNKASYIQTDAAINSGNSGGPLINSQGQVIGINTAKIKQSGVEGLGFAIPINAIRNKIQDLSKPILMVGIQGREIDKTLSTQYNLPIGLYIQDVTEFSPAEKSGLRRGDVITSFDGKKVTTFAEVNEIKNKHKAGDEVSLTVERSGKQVNLTLKFEEQ
ncbi:trypsin-like peptidase domain-containing protein [Clostridium swellfunianum]|uniref:S1C family serine protease n=1 Tax=Clostridium swellfunianum TaxID=1367462 RepID=UPI00202FA7F8|nr:trypsin-like peptidase domain-containing protein [Clostridium swellfunianum]MCM0647984.1 trypsin-like peptidase domain-containing protein [Clostridium swellfunianum]